MSHSHGGGNPDPHVITQGTDWDKMIGIAYTPTNWPDTSGWTATYVVIRTLPDGTEDVVLALGTSAGMTIEYNDGVDTTTTTSGITLGMQGEVTATTTLSGSAAEDATTVTITSATDVTIGATIVIALDDGSLAVHTIADLVGTTVTLSAPLADPATSGNVVTVYDADWAVSNVYLHLSKTATGDLTAWGVGSYRLDLIDPFGHVQVSPSGTSCLERGYGHG